MTDCVVYWLEFTGLFLFLDVSDICIRLPSELNLLGHLVPLS
jgi:hypothetical protein